MKQKNRKLIPELIQFGIGPILENWNVKMQDLIDNAHKVGLTVVKRGNLGTGVAKIKFFQDNGSLRDYHEGHGLFVALGIQEAKTWLDGYSQSENRQRWDESGDYIG